jgi:hypothetical protein
LNPVVFFNLHEEVLCRALYGALRQLGVKWFFVPNAEKADIVGALSLSHMCGGRLDCISTFSGFKGWGPIFYFSYL